MSEKISVLDHGYVQVIETWGSDERIVEAARMSTQRGFDGWGPKHTQECRIFKEPHGVVDFSEKPGESSFCDCAGVPGDEKLLAYLWKNKHYTPFEMAGMTIEVQAPIFVFREWHRHRTQSFNEMSARYAPLPDINYVPTIERLLAGGGHLTKQAAAVPGSNQIDDYAARSATVTIELAYRHAQNAYEEMLKDGVPKELARLVLPVGRYSRMRASANLRNWLAFLTLRADAKAQWEIRQFAEGVSNIVADKFPRTHALWADR